MATLKPNERDACCHAYGGKGCICQRLYFDSCGSSPCGVVFVYPPSEYKPWKPHTVNLSQETSDQLLKDKEESCERLHL